MVGWVESEERATGAKRKKKCSIGIKVVDFDYNGKMTMNTVYTTHNKKKANIA